MKKSWLGMLLLGGSLCGLTLTGAEKVLAEWKFDENLGTGDAELRLRGTAALADEPGRGKVLIPSAAKDGKAGGAVLTGPAEMIPGGAVTWSMAVQYAKPEAAPEKLEYMYLWDCKYVDKTGMTVILARDKANDLSLRIGVGNGEGVENFTVKKVALGDGQWHNLVLAFDADQQLNVLLDGKKIGSFVMLGKNAGPTRQLVVGDRCGSSYGALQGKIDDVKITVPEA